MGSTQIQISPIDDPLPIVKAPFAVLVDTDDKIWADDNHVVKIATQLLEMGCRYFVCAGICSEAVHDRIDDIVIEHGYDRQDDVTMTTFHQDETKEDALEFFIMVVIPDMNDAVILVHDVTSWEKLLREIRARS